MEVELKKVKLERGFSLIEILIAIAIMSLVALGIFALIPTGYTQTTNAGRLSIMSHYGQQKMDQLRGLGVDSDDLLNGIHPSTTLGETFPEFPPGTTEPYAITWFVSDGPPSDTKTVQVEVTYNVYKSDGSEVPDDEGINKNRYTFLTYITRD